MIPKKYRLGETELKKVLRGGKPFFSYGIVLNYKINNIGINRFSIILSGKNVNSGVERNFFRRRFYELCAPFVEGNYDFVFLVKKQTKFSMKDLQNQKDFNKDINFLLKKSTTLN